MHYRVKTRQSDLCILIHTHTNTRMHTHNQSYGCPHSSMLKYPVLMICIVTMQRVGEDMTEATSKRRLCLDSRIQRAGNMAAGLHRGQSIGAGEDCGREASIHKTNRKQIVRRDAGRGLGKRQLPLTPGSVFPHQAPPLPFMPLLLLSKNAVLFPHIKS